MSDQAQDFQEIRTDHFVAKVHRNPGCIVVMEISVTPSAAQAAYQKAVKLVNKEFSFPGFRKGHAPAAMIEEKFSKYIVEEWRRVLAETISSEVLKLYQVYPRTEKSVKKADFLKLSREEGAELYFEYECRPEVPEIDLRNFVAEPIEVKAVTEKNVEDSLYKLRLEKGTYNPIEGRPVQEGDFVLVDIDLLHGANKQPHRAAQGEFYEVGSSFAPAWINKLAIGMQAGNSADGELDCDAEDHTGHDHAVRLTLLEISEGAIAPITEELLKSVGCESEEVLRFRIKTQLEREQEEVRNNAIMNQIDRFLLNLIEFDVPKSMYEHSAKEYSRKQIAELKRQGGEEDLSEKIKEVEKNVEEDFKRAIRRYFITEKIAREHQLHVSEQEIQLEYLREVITQKSSGKMSEEDVSRLYTKVLHDKAMNYLRQSIEKK